MRVFPTINSFGEVRYVEVGEKGSSFYDGMYGESRNRGYSLPACESPVYPIWLKIVGKIGDEERVLDLGCGTGQLANVLVSSGKKFVLGVDFSVVGIEKAKSLMPFGRFEVGDIYRRWVYDVVGYDCVVLSEVMEHLEYDLAVLGHIKSGAHVIFTVPNYLTVEGSHVRAFISKSEIVSRYEKMVDIKGMEEVMMNKVENQKVWVVDSVRREVM